MSYQERLAQAVEVLRTRPQIPLSRTLKRLTGSILLTGDLFALHEHYSAEANEKQLARLREIVAELPLRDAVDEKSASAAKKEIEKQLEDNVAAERSQLGLRILNQGLVSLCTVFDVFLGDCMDRILLARPQGLYGDKRSPRSVDLKSIVEAGTVEAVLKGVRATVVREVAFDGIKARLGWFKKRGVPIDLVFEFKNVEEEPRKRMLEWSINRLAATYEDRHAVVHSDALPISNLNALLEVAEVLEQLSLGLAAAISAKFGLLVDMAMLAVAEKIAESATE